ncbi:AGAP012017-PA-like protein [Anopheles sinensis]|uniref:AGAP012017-PA-like protein n=1 Tax=Anopheles sinensis TaxID=74873 RepID=A0A084WI60_ANOSI|nr:AGAP012017-PA-like protein [Anopheles sinensis]
MNPQDFDKIAKNVYKNLDQINSILNKAKFISKFHTNDAGTDLPGVLLALTKEEEVSSNKSVNDSDSLERPCVEDIDTLFDTIRSHTASASKAPQRQGSFKKTTGVPLQQSRILNETNLLANGTMMMTGSSSDLTSISTKSVIHTKHPPVDVETLASRFRETIRSLTMIENRNIERIDLAQNRKRFLSEWASIEKNCRNVEALLDDCKQQLDSQGKGTVKQEPLISNDFIKSMKQLQSILHYMVYIKKTENLPDLSKTLSKEVFPLSECLDAVEETIRQKQL